MYLINTTFVCDEQAHASVAEWLTDSYVVTALGTGLFTRPILSRILQSPEPQTICYALQLQCDSLEGARAWINGSGAGLVDEFASQSAGELLYFTTEMAIIHPK